jgi:tetratricopeptide (TPR) repeat protein
MGLAARMGIIRPLLTALASLALSVNLCAQTSTSHTTVRHHKETVDVQNQALLDAEAALEKRDYATALPLLQQVVAADPANYQAWFDLGFLYNAQHQVDEAIDAYRKSVAANPDVFESNLNLGLMLAKRRDPEAEKFLRRATTLTPTDHPEEGRDRAWLSLARVLENSKPNDALDAYHQAAALSPNDPEPHISAGLLLERQKDFPSAEKEYRQVLALDPQSVEAATALTNIYMRSKKFADAESMLRTLTTARPDDAGLHVQLGRVLAAQGKNDDAIAEFQAGLKLSPNDNMAQLELANLYTSAGKFDQAEPIYRDLLKADPNNVDLHQALGHAYLQQKKFPEAQQEFLTVVKLKPDRGETYGDLAVTANEMQNYELVLKALEVRAKLLPEIPASYFLRATAYDHLKDFKDAAANYHQFLQVADGKYPDQEWQARHRLVAIEKKK